MIIRPFAVTVEGWPAYTYFARSRAQALSKAFDAYRGAYNDIGFKGFLKLAQCRSAAASERFGEEITVGGKRAFYVSHDRQYIQFVRPNDDTILNTHPLDVEPPEARRGTPYYKPAAIEALKGNP